MTIVSPASRRWYYDDVKKHRSWVNIVSTGSDLWLNPDVKTLSITEECRSQWSRQNTHFFWLNSPSHTSNKLCNLTVKKTKVCNNETQQQSVPERHLVDSFTTWIKVDICLGSGNWGYNITDVLMTVRSFIIEGGILLCLDKDSINLKLKNTRTIFYYLWWQFRINEFKNFKMS